MSPSAHQSEFSSRVQRNREAQVPSSPTGYRRHKRETDNPTSTQDTIFKERKTRQNIG